MQDPFHLLNPDFLQQARALRIVARRVAPGGRWAEHRSKDRGQGMEFRDFRPYSPGDELKTIDWNVFRRLGRIVVRLFEEMEDLPIYLMPDLSKSMWHDQPARAVSAMKTCVALSAIGLDQHDRVGVFPFGQSLDTSMRPTSGRGRLSLIAQSLTCTGLKAKSDGTGTDLALSLSKLRGLQLREGLLVIVSDWLDPRGIDSIMQELKRVRHRPILVSIAKKQDREPDLQGDIRVRDCETGDTRDLTVNAEILARYRDAYDAHFGQLKSFAQRRQGGFLVLDHDQDVMQQLASLFQDGRYVA